MKSFADSVLSHSHRAPQLCRQVVLVVPGALAALVETSLDVALSLWTCRLLIPANYDRGLPGGLEVDPFHFLPGHVYVPTLQRQREIDPGLKRVYIFSLSLHALCNLSSPRLGLWHKRLCVAKALRRVALADLKLVGHLLLK